MSTVVHCWADATWCYAEELSQFSHKSDDFETHTLPEHVEPDQIEDWLDSLGPWPDQ